MTHPAKLLNNLNSCLTTPCCKPRGKTPGGGMEERFTAGGQIRVGPCAMTSLARLQKLVDFPK